MTSPVAKELAAQIHPRIHGSSYFCRTALHRFAAQIVRAGVKRVVPYIFECHWFLTEIIVDETLTEISKRSIGEVAELMAHHANHHHEENAD